MNFIYVLVVTCIFIVAASKAIRAVPYLWYGLAVVLDILFVCSLTFDLPTAFLQFFSVTIQRCTLATALFAIVMYCGVFPKHSRAWRTIAPIRGKLSVIACILALAHCLNYLVSYLGVLFSNIGVIGYNQLISLLIAIVLFVLLLLLGVTSIESIKRRMKATTWKKIQQSSYLFFILIYFHELFVLYPSAMKNSGDSRVTLITSGIVFAAYLILRLARYLADGKEGNPHKYDAYSDEEVDCA